MSGLCQAAGHPNLARRVVIYWRTLRTDVAAEGGDLPRVRGAPVPCSPRLVLPVYCAELTIPPPSPASTRRVCHRRSVVSQAWDGWALLRYPARLK